MKSLLQTTEWGDFKSASGEWHHFVAGDFLVLVRQLPFGKCFFYIPEPISTNWGESLEKLLGDLKPEIEKYRPIFVRLEPLEKDSEEARKIFVANGLRPAFEEVQPKYRQWIPLEMTAEEILAQMKSKGRYNIKIAQQNNVKVNSSEAKNLEKDIDSFYNLIATTAKRGRFSIRPKKYFEDLLKLLYEKDLGRLYLAGYQGKIIAGAIITSYDHFADYLYGASSDTERNVMAPYLIHWQAMQDAKEKGCEIYDLLAIAPPGKDKHKHAGITRFKKQFGGEEITLVGGWDKVLSPIWYNLFKLTEKIRRR